MNTGPKITYKENARTEDNQDVEEMLISVQTASGRQVIHKRDQLFDTWSLSFMVWLHFWRLLWECLSIWILDKSYQDSSTFSHCCTWTKEWNVQFILENDQSPYCFYADFRQILELKINNFSFYAQNEFIAIVFPAKGCRKHVLVETRRVCWDFNI